MIGLPEILIVALIIFIVFGGYKRLPQIGRTAGKGLRIGGEKAKEIADSAEERVGDRVDAESIGRSAGKGARELREMRDALKGTSSSESKPAPAPTPAKGKPASRAQTESAEEAMPREAVPAPRAQAEPDPAAAGPAARPATEHPAPSPDADADDPQGREDGSSRGGTRGS